MQIWSVFQSLMLVFVEATAMNPSSNDSAHTARGGLARVATIRRMSEPDPVKRYTPQEAIAEVEELRRMFVARFGDPDAPIAKVVMIRRHGQ